VPILGRHCDPGRKRLRGRTYIDELTVYFDAPGIGRRQAIEGLCDIGAARADYSLETENFARTDCEAHLPEGFSAP
jgi:hypothetical protein